MFDTVQARRVQSYLTPTLPDSRIGLGSYLPFDVIFYGVIKQLHCVLSIHNHVTSRDY